MIVEVGENVYGWGADVRDLPNDPGAYGPKAVDAAEAEQLFNACAAEGWELFTKVALEERQVFLIAPKAWRRPITVKGVPGQFVQVREMEMAKEETERNVLSPLEKATRAGQAFDVPEDLVLEGPQPTPISGGGDQEEAFMYFLRELRGDPVRGSLVSSFEVRPSMTPGEMNDRFIAARDILREKQRAEPKGDETPENIPDPRYEKAAVPDEGAAEEPDPPKAPEGA